MKVRLLVVALVIHFGAPFSYQVSYDTTQLEAIAHPFFDEIRQPNARLPNGRQLPPLFNFKQEVHYIFKSFFIYFSYSSLKLALP